MSELPGGGSSDGPGHTDALAGFRRSASHRARRGWWLSRTSSFDLPSGEAIFMTIDLPRLKTVYVKGEVPAGNRPTLWLDTDGLLTELADHGILTSEPDGLLRAPGAETCRQASPGSNRSPSISKGACAGSRRSPPPWFPATPRWWARIRPSRYPDRSRSPCQPRWAAGRPCPAS